MNAYNPKAFWLSKINDYRHCPRFYDLKHNQGVPMDSKSLDLEYGSAIHLGVNDILENGGTGASIFKVYWDSVDPSKYPASRFNYETLRMNGEVHLARFARLHAHKFKPFKMEERIFTNLSGHLVEGTPDYLGEYEGETCVLDFKTTGSNYLPEKMRCEEQLSFYGALSGLQYDFKPAKRIYFIFKKDHKEPSIQKPLIAPLTEDVICSTIDNVVNTIEEIKSLNTFTKNTSNCIKGTMVCPAFQTCWGKKEQV